MGEVMHPVVGAAEESERLYVTQSRLAERLGRPGPPLVLFDVGLGAGSNALAALRAARRAEVPRRALRLLSFERELGALRLATSEEGSAALGLDVADLAAARALLASGRHEEPGALWRLVEGDLLETLPARPELAEVVFWDPYSPRHDPAPWDLPLFAALRRPLRAARGALHLQHRHRGAERAPAGRVLRRPGPAVRPQGRDHRRRGDGR